MWPDVDGRSNGYVINNFMYRRSSNHKEVSTGKIHLNKLCSRGSGRWRLLFPCSAPASIPRCAVTLAVVVVATSLPRDSRQGRCTNGAPPRHDTAHPSNQPNSRAPVATRPPQMICRIAVAVVVERRAHAPPVELQRPFRPRPQDAALATPITPGVVPRWPRVRGPVAVARPWKQMEGRDETTVSRSQGQGRIALSARCACPASSAILSVSALLSWSPVRRLLPAAPEQTVP